MGKLKIIKKLLGLASKKNDKIAEEVSKRSGTVDEEDVKDRLDKASDKLNK